LIFIFLGNEIDGMTLKLMDDKELDGLVKGLANKIKLKALILSLKNNKVIYF
jgi:hypothetical protein